MRTMGLRWERKGLACSLTLRSRLGAQPQGYVGGLHRLPYHIYQVVAECVQICFVAQLGREGLQRLSGIVLPTVEAPIDEALDAPPQGREQRGDHQGGCDHSECGSLAGE